MSYSITVLLFIIKSLPVFFQLGLYQTRSIKAELHIFQDEIIWIQEFHGDHEFLAHLGSPVDLQEMNYRCILYLSFIKSMNTTPVKFFNVYYLFKYTFIVNSGGRRVTTLMVERDWFNSSMCPYTTNSRLDCSTSSRMYSAAWMLISTISAVNKVEHLFIYSFSTCFYPKPITNEMARK